VTQESLFQVLRTKRKSAGALKTVSHYVLWRTGEEEPSVRHMGGANKKERHRLKMLGQAPAPCDGDRLSLSAD